jgi:hypothetical protein
MPSMCAACALTAMAGASGARSWLQAHRPLWLTDEQLKKATVGIFVAAAFGGTVMFSGSTPPLAHHAAVHSAQQIAAAP